ncbi:BAX inhibitor (BI)-1/YccA family protein [bacterium]|jgi:modulator of FtsH protease|nr:BAX inhibitor (BI)-1/YccA family protein [bacterium]NBW56220.1 BAX inhibitor (BI)-1/YccA family protein [bacterium]NBX71518.1 BAX inhibitor (BI)-1/YccA family protein [bacterium]
MVNRSQAVSRGHALSEQNLVMRNTMLLLSLNFLFSAFTAYLSMTANARPMGLGVLFVYMGLVFAIQAFRNSGIAILLVFMLTGILGYTLGPLLNFTLQNFSNGSAIISTAFLGTAGIFGGLSFYAMTTKEDMNYLAGFLTVGSFTVVALSILNLLFFQMPIMSLVVASAILLLSSGWILFELSAIVRGGQTNYILATVAIYVQLYNIFVSLIQILSSLSSRDR